MTTMTLSPMREQQLEHEIRQTIEALPRPAFIDHIEYEFGNDSTGDFAVWLYIIIRDDAEIIQFLNKRTKSIVEWLEARTFTQEVRDIVFQKYSIFTYTHLLTVSERAEGDWE